MAFREFRYHPDAEPGLVAILDKGRATFESLKERVRQVQDEWEPQDEDDLELIVVFEGFFLTFVVALEDASVLVLAAVEPVPEL